MPDVLKRILNLWATEPAMVVGVVLAVLALLTSFGIPITVNQQTAVRGVLEAVGVIVAAYVVRSQVTPVAKAA